MSVELIEDHDGKVLTVRATGKLEREDYHHFLPEFERLIQQHGKIRVLFDMHNFQGWKLGAIWEDVKFDVKHYNDIELLAVVGESEWEQWMAMFCLPFTTAKVKYFDHADRELANAWIHEGLPHPTH
ncbi:MAG: STAS/SEC14 domain-containing protein [Planctomycetaceae bacterium]|nr:STAS/SEC14 domain-containing protein [Planctomycetales bacterium]MCB9924214.1 STAS/SEC14 domain-containing protein [Planctomycetaceae bacterium]